MSPVERNQSLTNRPPEVRARILAKVREYLALGPDGANCGCARRSCAGI